jgi:hypothetical protein
MDSVDGVLLVYLVHSPFVCVFLTDKQASSFFFLKILSSSLNRREREETKLCRRSSTAKHDY